MTILADYSTICPDCDEWTDIGDPIHLIVGRGWAHITCPAEPATACREICNRCFTEKAGNGTCMCGDR